jgi:hypothetical protein
MTFIQWSGDEGIMENVLGCPLSLNKVVPKKKKFSVELEREGRFTFPER